MAFRGILEDAPSFSTMVARNLGKGITQGVGQGFNIAKELSGKQNKLFAERQKLAGKTLGKLPKLLRDYAPEIGDRDYGTVADLYNNILLSNPNISEHEVFSEAVKQFKGSQPNRFGEGKMSSQGIKREGQGLLGNIFNSPRITEASEEESPEQRTLRRHLGRLTPQEREQEGYGALSVAKNHPGEALGGYGSRLLGALESFGAARENPLKQTLGKEYEAYRESLGLSAKGKSLAERLGEATGYEGLPEEAKEKLESLYVAADFLPTALSPFFKGAQAAEGAGQVAQKLLPREALAAEEAIPEALEAAKPKSLTGRVQKGEITPTEMRMQRLNPTERMHPTKEIVRIRQEQLKAYPKYAEEIAKDAAEREARRLAKVPKTEKGVQGLEQRRVIAQSRLPKFQDSYDKAIARVRALESEIPKYAGAERENLEKVLQVFKEELNESQLDFKNAFNNAKYGEARATIDEARNAARQKLLQISDEIFEGKDVALKGYDYSPKMVSEAKALSNKKALPKVRTDDFYNDIHETYLKEYRNRLGQIKQELETFPSKELVKERDLIKNMVQSAEAEKTIHNHKLALREIDEAKKLRDRLGKTTPRVTEPKVERVWKDKVKSAKTPEAKDRLVDEIVSDASKVNPESSQKIQAEGEKLKGDVERIFEEKPPGETAHPKFEKQPGKEQLREKMSWLGNRTKQMRDYFDKMPRDFPELWKYKPFQDFAVGLAFGVGDEMAKELDVPTEVTFLAKLGFGRYRRYPSGLIIGIGNYLGKKVAHKYRVDLAKRAYERGDPKFREYPKKIREEAKQKLQR